jgi:lactate permease
MLAFICFIVLGQAYLYPGIIPEYQMLTANAAAATPDFSRGYTYLLVLALVLIALAAVIVFLNRNKITEHKVPTLPVTK